ncbi:MAG: enoyl-CoA hydratase/isomerase family protein [Thermodesulfobacteriota bacterium]|nr:enoyl-CoA hydratase/isomerase family protein [Thermodesulfobacteriota bacterium]
MSEIDFIIDDGIAVVTMRSGENRLNLEFLSEFLQVLDDIENTKDAKVLVVKSAHEKIFSNGIDLDWLVPILNKNDMETGKEFIRKLMELYKRILMFPMPTIAAINGHAFAGGAIMTCYFDYRFMRSDRGFLCFPEVDLGIPFLPGMIKAMKKAVPLYKLEEMVYEGKRMTAEECEKHNIVKKACHIDTLMDEVMTFAKTLNKRREVIIEMKKEMNKEIVYALDVEDQPIIESARFYV